MIMIRCPRISAAYVTAAIATAFIAGTSVEGLAQSPSNPIVGQVWGGCVLSDTALAGLVESIRGGPGLNPDELDIGFVVVHSKNDGNGQRLGGGFTLPVVCRNDAVFPTINQVNQDANIPGTVDILDVQGGLTVLTEDSSDNRLKRFCWAGVGGGACFDMK